MQLIEDFDEKVVIQSFTVNYNDIADKISELDECYTKLGWKSFKTALAQSGNLRATIDEKLLVSAKTPEEIQLIEKNTYAPNWKMMIPIIIYENKSHFLDQRLKVKMIIGLENKALGVEQMIGSPPPLKHEYGVPLNQQEKTVYPNTNS